MGANNVGKSAALKNIYGTNVSSFTQNANYKVISATKIEGIGDDSELLDYLDFNGFNIGGSVVNPYKLGNSHYSTDE
ncbi:MAG: hypothetical protein ACR2KZ_23075 [Segetibacter sp.]